MSETKNDFENEDASSAEPLAIRAPATSPGDERIPIRITGAAPSGTVEFEASLNDAEGTTWRSRATYTADADGVVDLTDQRPDSGSYEGVEPMGWLWSMESGTDAPFASFGDMATVSVELRATAGERQTERTIDRRLYDDGITRRPVDHPDLVGTLYEPPGDGPHPGVVELHGSGGRRSARLARLLASNGFAVLAIEYFGNPDPIPDELGRIPLSYFDAAATWLREQPTVTDGNVGVVGSSRGGELALVLGSRFDWVGAVVAYAGSGVVYDTPDGTPAWVDDGEPLPSLTGVGEPERTDDGNVVTRPMLERGLEAADEATRRAATIRVEETGGPVLLLSGGDDTVWPARRLSEVAVDRLERAGFEHAFDHLTYDSVGHLISVPFAPLSGVSGSGVGGTARATAHAAADSWPTVLEYLDRGLAGHR